jgi:hypothetical protein
MIPHLYLAGAVAVVTLAGGFIAGVKVTNWHRDSEQLAIKEAAQEAGIAASTAAVDAISKIDIKRVTIRQELEREIRTEPAPPAVCDISASMQDTLNRAITGSEPAGTGMSPANPATGPVSQ